MAKAAIRPRAGKYQRFFKRHLPYLQKVSRHITLWNTFWFVFFLFIYSSIYWNGFSDKIIEIRAKQTPPLSTLPANAQWDVPTTMAYMKEKRLVVRSNLTNVWGIVKRDMGLKRAEGTKLASLNAQLPISTKLDKENLPVGDNRPVEGDFNIIKDNLSEAFHSYVYMLSVKIVSITNKTGPPTKLVVADNGKMVPYDQTDRILRWSRQIETAANKYHVDPAIIAAIIEQESGGNPNAGSHAGAIGLMQLMPRTAKGLGVDPYDPEQNIDGGTRYFLYQYKRFGNVEQALAAYNAGPGNVLNGNYLYIAETQGYIRKVPSLIRKYQQTFNNESAVNNTGPVSKQ